MASFDALIIGASLDGLVAGAFLAQAGLKCAIIERSEMLGGTFRDGDVVPEVRAPALRHDIESFPADVSAQLGLSRYGLSFVRSPGSVSITPAGMFLAPNDIDATLHAVTEGSKRDGEALAAMLAEFERLAQVLRPALSEAPVHPFANKGAALRLLRTGGGIDLIDSLAASASDYLEQRLESPTLREHLALEALALTGLAPNERGTAFLLAFAAARRRLLGQGLKPEGGAKALIDALLQAFAGGGGELLTGRDALTIVVRGGRVRGVALTTGDTIHARYVFSSLDLRRTFLTLLDASSLPAPLAEGVRRYRTRGHIAKVALALDGQPSFTDMPRDFLGGQIMISPGMNTIATQLREAREGMVPVRPWLDIRVAGQANKRNLISVLVHGVPYQPNGGWTTGRQEELIGGVLHMLEEAAPGLAAKVTSARLASPQDFETEYRLSGGDLMGGAYIPSQLLWNRPLPEVSEYAMPAEGLYLCGGSVHPGGMMPGQNGANAARTLLTKLGKPGGTRG